MRIISQKRLKVFANQYPAAKAPLSAWYKAAKRGAFKNIVELKQTFGSVDYVPVGGRGFCVFDIGGNNFRLIAAIHFNTQMLFVRHILTHSEYDKGNWKQ